MTLLPGTLGHGQLTVPLVRGDSQGRRESYEQRAPVYTMGGNRGGYSATSHLAPEDSGRDFCRGRVCVVGRALLRFYFLRWVMALVGIGCGVWSQRFCGFERGRDITSYRLSSWLQAARCVARGHDKMCSIVREWSLQH